MITIEKTKKYGKIFVRFVRSTENAEKRWKITGVWGGGRIKIETYWNVNYKKYEDDVPREINKNRNILECK